MSGFDLDSLPKHWELVTMGEIAHVVGGSTPKSKQPEFWGGDIPWLGVADLTGYAEKYIARGARSITKAGYDSCSTQMVPEGTVLFSSRAPIGYVAIASQPLCTSQGFKSFVLSDRVSPEYMYWYLKSAKGLAESMASGTTFKELSGKTAAQLPVPLPPRAEQERIVAAIEETLSYVEVGVASFAEVARLGTLYEKAVLQEALGNCVVPNADEVTGALPEIPNTWRWSTVAEEGLVQLGRMLNKQRSTGPHLKPYLRVANVLDDRLDFSDVKQMDFPPDEYERYLLHPGDILLNEGQSPDLLGRAAMYRGEQPGLCFQKTLLRFQAGPRVDPEFALLVFRHYLYAGRFQRESRITTGIGHLTQVRFAAMEFPVPPRAEQEAIVRHVREQLDSAARFREVILKTQQDAATLRASILKDAFSGGLSRPRAGDHPADALIPLVQADRAEEDLMFATVEIRALRS